jgi:hypothetical protein
MRVTLAILAAICGSASSAYANMVTKVMPAGATLKAGHYYAVNADCSLMGYATLRITNAPQHGTLTTRRGKEFPHFPQGSPYADCNTRRVDSMIADYKPERTFVGSDYMTIDVFFPNGVEQTYDYQIIVK